MQKYTLTIVLITILLLAWSLANILFSIQMLNQKIDSLGTKFRIIEASMSAVQTRFDEWGEL